MFRVTIADRPELDMENQTEQEINAAIAPTQEDEMELDPPARDMFLTALAAPDAERTAEKDFLWANFDLPHTLVGLRFPQTDGPDNDGSMPYFVFYVAIIKLLADNKAVEDGTPNNFKITPSDFRVLVKMWKKNAYNNVAAYPYNAKHVAARVKSQTSSAPAAASAAAAPSSGA